MGLRGFILVALFAAAAVIGLSTFLVASPGRIAEAVPLPNGQTIYAKALTNHECDSEEWHFVINQIDDESLAPAYIQVSLSDGIEYTVLLTKFTGKVAHYTTTDALDFVVLEAKAHIYSEWSGQFNLSHGSCETTAPTPTPTPVITPTPAVTPTLTPVATSTFQAPAAFPNSGGEPAEGDGGGFADTLATIGILLLATGIASLAFWALFRRG